MPLLDLLICIVMVALGAVLMHWVDESRERAVKKERDRAESWKHAYTSLRYDTKPYESPEPVSNYRPSSKSSNNDICHRTDEGRAPAPLQLNAEDAWAVRCNNQTTRSKRA